MPVQPSEKHFKDLDVSLEGRVAADNWAITRRQRILDQISFASSFHDIFNPVFSSDEEDKDMYESLQVVDGMEGVWDSDDERWWRGMFGHSNKRQQSGVQQRSGNFYGGSPGPAESGGAPS